MAKNLDTDVGDADNGQREVIKLFEISFRPAHGGNGLDLGVRASIPFRRQFDMSCTREVLTFYSGWPVKVSRTHWAKSDPHTNSICGEETLINWSI